MVEIGGEIGVIYETWPAGLNSTPCPCGLEIYAPSASGLVWCCVGVGLPNGKLGLSSKGRLVSTEKASRNALIWAWTSGICQCGVHCSRIRMWRTKKSRPSVFSAGSGDVMEACYVSLWAVSKSRKTYKMKHCASEHTVYGKTDPTLHTHQSDHTVCLKYAFLDSAHPFCRIMTNQHVCSPVSVGFC